MTKTIGQYTLTITDNETGKVVHKESYKGMSGTAMMDEAKYYRRQYPATKYTIDW